MGIRQDVKAGFVSSKGALTTLELSEEVITSGIDGWLKRRIRRGADAEAEAVREKEAERAEAEVVAREKAEAKKKGRNKKRKVRR